MQYFLYNKNDLNIWQSRFASYDDRILPKKKKIVAISFDNQSCMQICNRNNNFIKIYKFLVIKTAKLLNK